MGDFTQPFVGLVPSRKMTNEELVRAIRLDAAAELDAIHLYTAHADATDNPLARKVLLSVADEEKVHLGEFLTLSGILAPDESKYLAQGAQEVNSMRGEAMIEAEAKTKGARIYLDNKVLTESEEYRNASSQEQRWMIEGWMTAFAQGQSPYHHSYSGNNPSPHCTAVLIKPLDEKSCSDFRGIRSRNMCCAWDLMDHEHVSFGKAIKRCWDQTLASCHKVGVHSPEPVEPEKTVELLEEGKRVGMISLMKDGRVEFCHKYMGCDITSKPSPESFELAQAFFSSAYGMQVRPMEVAG